MPDNLCVVVGASGHVGHGGASALLEQKKRVRVVGRRADALGPLKDRGAEVMAGNVEDEAFLKRAFEGATAAFILISSNLSLPRGFRDWQKRVADNQVNALKAAKVPYVVALSSIGAELAEGTGPIVGLHHLEERLKTLSANVLMLRPGYYFENNLGSIQMIKAMGLIGGALRADLPMVQIGTADIARILGKRLLTLDWKGNTVEQLFGPRGPDHGRKHADSRGRHW